MSSDYLLPINGSDLISHDYAVVASVSQISGILSLFVWLFAQLPQVIENHLNQSVSGVSAAFLICWISGDATNLVGCLLTKALPFQICLAAYYCFIDFILSLQFWYYTRVYPRQKEHHNLLQSPNMMRPVVSRGSTHNNSHTRTNRFESSPNNYDLTTSRSQSSGRRFRVKRKNFIHKILSSSVISGSFGKAQGMPINPELSKRPVSFLEKVKSTLSVVGPMLHQLRGHIHYNSAFIGTVSGWLSSILYLSSRSPQIWKNYTNKSTKGVSPYLFFFALVGNTFYTISILSDLYLLSKYDQYMGEVKYHDVFMAQLPFIVGSSGTVMFDCVLLFQCWYYRETPEPTRRSLPHIHALLGESFGSSEAAKHAKKGKSDSITHFTKPDWYTNNYSAVDEQDDFQHSRYGATRNSSSPMNQHRQPHNETAMLRNNNFHIPPPPHYISSSFSQNANSVLQNKGAWKGISGTFGAIARSISHSSSLPKSPASLTSNHSLVVKALPVPGTSLIPSLIGNYSSVSRKLTNDSKVPFLPIDFLHDDFTRRGHGLSQDH